jgi:hypothetical protein
LTNITKKQASIAVLAVFFATAMIASVIASPDSAFARHHHKHHHGANTHGANTHGANTHDNGKSISQSISQGCSQNQHSSVVTAGAGSPVSGSGNNVAACANVNLGGNAAVNN